MEDISEITEYLCVSGYSAVQPHLLKLYNFTCVINTAAELPSLKTERLGFPMDYLHVEMYDHESADLLSYLDTCVDKIHQVQQQGGKSLVHCLGGVSRSVSVCAGYLIKYCGMSVKDAMSRIIAVRPQANPNPGFCEQLAQYERFFVQYNEDQKST